MNYLQSTIKYIIIALNLVLYTIVSLDAQTPFYWGGGSGDWDDTSHWFKDENLTNLTGVLPSQGSAVHFTDNSSTTSDWTVTIPPGSYNVHSILVETEDDFLIQFDGVDNNVVVMNVYKNLSLQPTHRLEYASSPNQYNSNNKWVFKGSSSQQNISTGNHDLLRVEFLNANVIFNQLSNLKASQQILMLNGTWNTNGNNVNAGLMLFNDGLPSNANRPPRVINTAGSNIICDEWDSRNTYGSFNLAGNHSIYVKEFKGSPTQINGIPFLIDNIYLLEYMDNTDGSTSAVDHANFECTGCIIESMIIEDTGRAILAGAFTINEKLTIVEHGVNVEFNGSNNRSNEVTINGSIVTPQVNSCDEKRTVFTNIYNDFTNLIRTSGDLTIQDAVLINIQPTGNDNFILSEGVLQGSSSGWSIINPPNATDYYWQGETGIIHDWNNPNFWTLFDGTTNGCVPSIVDNVILNSGSKGDIRIPENYTAVCRDLIWTNIDGLELTLDGTSSLRSTLMVTGNFELDQSATITSILYHQLIFSSTSVNTINTQDVQLPNVKFLGDDAEWTLLNDFSCDRLDFEAGTFKTNGQSVTTDLWTSLEENPKHYDFSSSNIIVYGAFNLSVNNISGVTVDPGTSLIECETLTSSIFELYDVQVNNPSAMFLGTYPYSFNKLILNGDQINTQRDLTVNIVEFKAEGSALALDGNYLFTVNQGIISSTDQATPGILKSKTPGSSVEIESDGNICTKGFVQFEDIQSIISGVFHAPDGIDGGNNIGINYDPGTTSNTLYWIAESGGTWQVRKNWSVVDGGCPSTKDPSDSQNLEFNQHSFSTTPITIAIPEGESANNIYFRNTENLTIDVKIKLTIDNPYNIFVEGAFVNFIGKTLNVAGKIDINSNGLMTTDMENFNTNELISNSGAFIVRSGSTARINP